jgi:predicted transcriptional regulator
MTTMPGKPQEADVAMGPNVFVRLTDDLNDAINYIAQSEDRPRSRVIRALLREALEARRMLRPPKIKQTA